MIRLRLMHKDSAGGAPGRAERRLAWTAGQRAGGQHHSCTLHPMDAEAPHRDVDPLPLRPRTGRPGYNLGHSHRGIDSTTHQWRRR